MLRSDDVQDTLDGYFHSVRLQQVREEGCPLDEEHHSHPDEGAGLCVVPLVQGDAAHYPGGIADALVRGAPRGSAEADGLPSEVCGLDAGRKVCDDDGEARDEPVHRLDGGLLEVVYGGGSGDARSQDHQRVIEERSDCFHHYICSKIAEKYTAPKASISSQKVFPERQLSVAAMPSMQMQNARASAAYQ